MTAPEDILTSRIHPLAAESHSRTLFPLRIQETRCLKSQRSSARN
jgi:hypothetical protein